MRNPFPPEVEAGRVAGEPGQCYGAFEVLHPGTGRRFHVIASDGLDWAECGLTGPHWEHVSVSHRYGLPTWGEMCWVKALFWGPDEWVVQFHPAEADYVNRHPNCLHLWKLAGAPLPTPPKECV